MSGWDYRRLSGTLDVIVSLVRLYRPRTLQTVTLQLQFKENLHNNCVLKHFVSLQNFIFYSWWLHLRFKCLKVSLLSAVIQNSQSFFCRGNQGDANFLVSLQKSLQHFTDWLWSSSQRCYMTTGTKCCDLRWVTSIAPCTAGQLVMTLIKTAVLPHRTIHESVCNSDI